MAAARILCIDDEKEILDLIHLILGRKGYEVAGAIGGEAGLAKARSWKPDLVLLDLMMPDMDGWEVFHRLRADETRAKYRPRPWAARGPGQRLHLEAVHPAGSGRERGAGAGQPARYAAAARVRRPMKASFGAPIPARFV
jgi:CheY-like chemotaxis protein